MHWKQLIFLPAMPKTSNYREKLKFELIRNKQHAECVIYHSYLSMSFGQKLHNISNLYFVKETADLMPKAL